MLTENRENPFALALVDLTRPRAAAIVRFHGALPPEFLPADSSLLEVKPLESDANGCNLLPLRADVAQLVEQRFRKP